jgi:hypothetical protein
LSQIRDGANSASITGGNVRTTGPTPRGQNPARRATAVRRVDRDLELDRRTNEEAHMMSRLLQEAEEEEYEDSGEEYNSQNEDEDDKDDLEKSNEDEDDDEEQENDLECYLRKRGLNESRLRARTAPLRPMERIGQFRMTPNFTNLE